MGQNSFPLGGEERAPVAISFAIHWSGGAALKRPDLSRPRANVTPRLALPLQRARERGCVSRHQKVGIQNGGNNKSCIMQTGRRTRVHRAPEAKNFPRGALSKSAPHRQFVSRMMSGCRDRNAPRWQMERKNAHICYSSQHSRRPTYN